MAARLIDDGALERDLSAAWSLRVIVRSSDAPLGPSALAPGEVELLGRLAAPARRASWLLGRAALKRALRDLGEDDDTSRLAFPHPRLSLTHSGGWAVAVAANGARGVGVDLELGRAPRQEAERKFLSEGERARLDALGPAARPREVLRLWTVKEAAYKADPDGRGGGLAGFEVEGDRVRRGGRTFLARSFEVPGGFLSAVLLPAVAPSPDPE